VTWVGKGAHYKSRHYTIAAGATLTLVYTVSVSGCSPGTHVNSVRGRVGSEWTPPATAKFRLGAASVTLTKDGYLDKTATPPNDRANVGDVIHYTMTATNTGEVYLDSVVLYRHQGVGHHSGEWRCQLEQPDGRG